MSLENVKTIFIMSEQAQVANMEIFHMWAHHCDQKRERTPVKSFLSDFLNIFIIR